MGDMTQFAQARHGESLKQVRARFKRWRETRVRGERIPAVLWAAALGIAREHGPERAVHELRVDYDGLKRRLEQTGDALQGARIGTQFVELTVAPAPLPAANGMCECVIALENARGAKMRVELNGNGLVGLAGLCSALWSGA